MYGLGNLIGNMFTGAVTPAIGSAITEATRGGISEAASGLFSHKVADTLGKIGGTALGTLAGAGLGAGLGALTEGKYGAYGGAATGAMGGGWGGIKSGEIQKALGFGEVAQPTGAPSGPMQLGKPEELGISVTNVKTPSNLPSSAAPQSTLQKGDLMSQILGKPQTPTNLPQTEAPELGQQQQKQQIQDSGINLGDYMDIAGKSFIPSVTAGTGLTANLVQQYWASEAQKKAQAEEAAKQAQLQQWAASLYPQYYAEGGPIKMEINSPAGPVRASYPEWFVKDVMSEGGIGALTKSFSNGGYLNNMLPPQDDQHPQSLIPKAAPQPGAAPVRQEVVQTYEHGGLLNGDGDGMSDSIPAEIDGKEPVRVADGEYVVPKHIAEAKQAELKRMMSKVRSAAHPKKGQQIKQDAAKRAFIHTMSGVKA